MFLKNLNYKKYNKFYQNSYYKGFLAEYLVKIYLRLLLFKIVEHRFKTNLGEIDIIASKNNLLIAVEVKYRSNIDDIKNMNKIISPKQINRVKNNMNLFCHLNKKYLNYKKRYDLVIINKFFIYKYLANFFT